MKRFILVSLLMLGFISAFAQSGRSLYQKYSDADGVSAVFISQSMFRMMGRLPDIDAGSGDVNLAPIIQSLSGLYIIDSENPAVNADIKADVNRLLNSGAYEMLMEAKDNGETVRIYTAGNDSVVTSFVLVSLSGPEATFICLDGRMDRTQLEQLLAKGMAE